MPQTREPIDDMIRYKGSARYGFGEVKPKPSLNLYLTSEVKIDTKNLRFINLKDYSWYDMIHLQMCL